MEPIISLESINFITVELLPTDMHIFIIGCCDILSETMMFFVSKKYQKLIGTIKISKKIICSRAAFHGYLNILQWARDYNCKSNALTCSSAAFHGARLIYAT